MKKYGNLHPPLVRRVFNEAQNEKAAKTRLHQLYGAYIQPNSVKKAAAFLKKLESTALTSNEKKVPLPLDMKSHSTAHLERYMEDIVFLLKLHSSTQERLPFLHEFYDYIKSVVGEINSVLDLGCGFNPFSLPFFPWNIKEYHAIDIDFATRNLINIFFGYMELPKHASCADLITETPQVKTDLAFMLKLLPVLETYKPGRGYELANSINAKWLVITFPTRSLGGKNIGMEKNYTDSFREATQNNQLDNFNLSAENRVGSELIFVLKKV